MDINKFCSTNLSELYQSRLDLFQQKSQTVSQHRWNCKRPTQKRFALIMNHSWVQRCKLFWFQIILSHKLWLTNDRQVANHPWPQLPILNFANCWNQKMKSSLFAPDDFEGSDKRTVPSNLDGLRTPGVWRTLSFGFGQEQNWNLVQIFRKENQLSQNCLYQATLYCWVCSVA